MQTIFVDARGLLGLLYWYLTYAIHAKLFGGLIHEIACRADSCEPFQRESRRATLKSRLLSLLRAKEQPL